MSRNKVDELTRHAVAQVQKLAKDQGFKRLPNEKAFMDELSGEDDGPRIIVRRRFTTLSDAELAEARVWWEGLSEGEKMRRRDDAASRRETARADAAEADRDAWRAMAEKLADRPQQGGWWPWRKK